ncbi:MAG: hypothetical protein RR219_00795 [Clostridiales bacterium]
MWFDLRLFCGCGLIFVCFTDVGLIFVCFTDTDVGLICVCFTDVGLICVCFTDVGLICVCFYRCGLIYIVFIDMGLILRCSWRYGFLGKLKAAQCAAFSLKGVDIKSIIEVYCIYLHDTLIIKILT